MDRELGAALDRMAGLEAGPEYDEERVRNLVVAARRGNRERGAEVFLSSQAGCAACHQVGGAGGMIGPDLSAVGSGLLPERIVTEVLWPRLQVKEGYALSRIITRDGGVQQGYVQASRDEGILLLRDFATSSLHEIARSRIARQEEIGSLMPPTAQEFPEKDLADLFAYLFSLNGKQ
ncbi:MAG: c-type cytochrome [Roseibacillus sp.]|nr:c-type cytochrome [Roseibacillus sp.]